MWLWALVAMGIIVVLFFLGDVARWWLDDRRLEAYSRSDAELLAYPALLRGEEDDG
jgi:hypothetical protein